LSGFRCHMISFSNSSISVSVGDDIVRIYHESKGADRYLTVAPFTTDIGPGSVTNPGEPWFKVSNTFTWQLLYKARNAGVPFYLAWDTYVFIMSLLLIPNVYLAVFGTSDDTLRTVMWDSLWFPEDSQTVSDRYLDAISRGSSNDISTIFKILKGIKLKCRLTLNLIPILANVF